jgi:hypothetical protein
VIGEFARGHLSQRRELMGLLTGLPQATVATADEVLTLVERHQLYGLGIGYVDAQLLAATRLTPDAELWTNDGRLVAVASRLGCVFDPRARAAEDQWAIDGQKRVAALEILERSALATSAIYGCSSPVHRGERTARAAMGGGGATWAGGSQSDNLSGCLM